MCHFFCRSEAQPDQVCLEIHAAGGRLSAALKPPAREPELIAFEHVPLLRAVKMAKLMGDVLRTDIVVVDHVGMWDEWLLERAFEPDMAPAVVSEDDTSGAAAGGSLDAGWTGALHAPPR